MQSSGGGGGVGWGGGWGVGVGWGGVDKYLSCRGFYIDSWGLPHNHVRASS